METHGQEGVVDKKCREVLDLVGGDFDEMADGDLCRRLEEHLAACPRCRVVVDSTRKTIRLFRDDDVPCMPHSFDVHLHALLKACWEAKAAQAA